MTGFEALEKAKNRTGLPFGEFAPVTARECEIIEKELKVLNILKEKKVDISLIDNLISKAKEIWKVELKKAITEFTIRYNARNNIRLTEEEMELIVGLLEGE